MTQENGPKRVATKEGREEKVGRPKEGGPRGRGGGRARWAPIIPSFFFTAASVFVATVSGPHGMGTAG